jgi:hypothetical protein
MATIITLGFLVLAFFCVKAILAGFVLIAFAKNFDQGEGTLSFLGLLMLVAGIAGIYFGFKVLPFSMTFTG